MQSSWVEYNSDSEINDYIEYLVLALERPGEDIDYSKVAGDGERTRKGAPRVTCRSDTDHE
jgi:hypothetical protein